MNAVSPRVAKATPAPVAGQPIVEVRGVSKVYGGGVTALDNVDLRFETGRLTSLLG